MIKLTTKYEKIDLPTNAVSFKNIAEFKYKATTKFKIDRESFISYLMEQKTQYIVLSHPNGETFNLQIDFED